MSGSAGVSTGWSIGEFRGRRKDAFTADLRAEKASRLAREPLEISVLQIFLWNNTSIHIMKDGKIVEIRPGDERRQPMPLELQGEPELSVVREGMR